MRSTLHILTKPDDTLAQQIIEQETKLPDTRVEMVDLTRPNPNYQDVVEKIFAADSVQVW